MVLALATFAAFAIPASESGAATPRGAAKVRIAGPAQALAGAAVRLSPRARLPRDLRPISAYTLVFGDGSASLRGARLPRKGVTHVYRRSGSYTAKLVVVDAAGNRRAARKQIVVRQRTGALAASAYPQSSAPGPGPGPGPIPPLALSAAPVSLPPGSTATVVSPDPLTAVTGVDGVANAPSGVTALVQDGRIVIAADAAVLPLQSRVLAVTGSGCTATGCDRRFEMQVPLSIRELAAPPGPLTAFTAASPDRVDAGEPLSSGGVRLVDELVVTFGTPDAPGTRFDAELAAEAFGAVVSGGVEEIGVYELRWETPQDVDQLRQELLGWPGVTSVGDSTLGLVELDALPPGDWSDDGPQATWSFTATRAQQAWDTTKGSGVTVGIVDGGQVFSGHEDLKVVERVGLDGPDLHATHVAGTACAKANGVGVVGFAWGCPIVTSGWGDRSDKAILAAATAVAKRGAKVVNMSIGYSRGGCPSGSVQDGLIARAGDFKDEFRQLFRGPTGRDVVWTVSAGNNCAAGVASPWGLNSDLGNVIAVAATNSNGQLARFSSFGAGVEVAAPGGVSVSPIGDGTVGIWSTAIDPLCILTVTCLAYAAKLPDGRPFAGTSMAAPAVAGIAALVRAAHPGFGASRAAGCIVGSAGAGTGTVTSRSSLPTGPAPQVAYAPADLPIADAEAAVACDGLVFDGSPGTGPPPSTLGPYTMTAFGPDARPELESVSSVPDPAGTLGFSPSLTHRRVPSTWLTWSHGYGGDVYSTGFEERTVELTLPPGTDAFAFYAEPNTFESFTVEAIAQDGTSSEPIDIEGNSGARYFGFYGTGGKTVASIQVSASDPSGFAIGEFQIAR